MCTEPKKTESRNTKQSQSNLSLFIQLADHNKQVKTTLYVSGNVSYFIDSRLHSYRLTGMASQL
jgi:hypothetical protein